MSSIKPETNLMVVSEYSDFDGTKIFVLEHASFLADPDSSEACRHRFILEEYELPASCPSCNLKIRYDLSGGKKTTYQRFYESYTYVEKVKMTQAQRFKAEQLLALVKKENKTLKEKNIELELSKFLDEQGLCFTDL